MAINYDEFNKQLGNKETFLADMEQKSKPKEKTESDSTEFKDVVDGSYRVTIEGLELYTSSKGNPTIKTTFRIHGGDFDNQCMWYYRRVLTSLDFVFAQRYLESLQSGFESVKFDGDYESYDKLLHAIHDATVSDDMEFVVSKSTNDKNFTEYTIDKVFIKGIEFH